jgi:hypothetical protein
VRKDSAMPAVRRDPVTRRTLDLQDARLEASCGTTAATALSYANGKYGISTPVIQAVSLYCVQGTTSCTMSDPELPPLADKLKTDANNLRMMGEIAEDHFLHGVSNTLIGTIEWLATPCDNGGALGKTAQNLLEFFNLPEAQRNQILTQSASDAANLFKSDPARFFGEQAPNVIPAEKGIQLAKTAAANLRAVNLFAQKFGNFAAVLKGTKFNPAQCMTNCFWTSLAYDETRATWKLSWAASSPPIDGRSITDVLRRAFGSKGIDPYHGPLGTLAHRLRIPVPSSKGQIERALQTAADADARGLVFVREPGQVGHVFNAFKHNGQVYFYDAQIGVYANPQYFRANAEVFFYRTN